MTNIESIKKLLVQFQQSANDPVPLLQKLVKDWKNEFEPALVEVLKGNNVFAVLAKVMNDNFNAWHTNFPSWITEVMSRFYKYNNEATIFTNEQIQLLVQIFRKYVMSGCWDIMNSFFLLAIYKRAQELLLEDDELYNFMKVEINKPFVVRYFGNCASRGFDPWKLKLLKDKPFVLAVLALDSAEGWNLLVNLGAHPDAKEYMPNEVVAKAGSSKTTACINLYAVLCSDKDLKDYELDAGYFEVQFGLLEKLLKTGYAAHNNQEQGLRSLIRPLCNLSVADSYKERLGEKAVKLMLTVVTDKLLDVPLIQRSLPQSKIEAARTLWNLAYLDINCKRIKEDNGIKRLEKAITETEDADLKRHIEGILHMCNGGQIAKPTQIVVGQKSVGHVMISYNWDNQPIVKQIARSLQGVGYNVWLDTEQMGGSTLEAMASAVEQSEVVLLCMSQKYKDSPNCRLEGEYCVNKRKAFIPLMMQRGFAPDGWLGITLGAKLWYDFTSENDWESKIAGLTKALGERGKSNAIHAAHTAPLESHAPNPKQDVKKATEWTAEDIFNWMKSEQIDDFTETYELLRKNNINGKALLELKNFLINPQHFSIFESICQKTGIEKIGTVLQLAAAIRKL